MATTGEILSTIRRKKSLGQTVSDRFVKNLFAAELDVERGRALEAERVGISRRANESLEAFRQRTLEQQERAATVSGVTSIGLLGLGTETGRTLVGAGLKKVGFEKAGSFISGIGKTAVPTTGAGAFATEAVAGAGAFVPGTIAPTGLTTGAVETAVVGTEAAVAGTAEVAGAGIGLATPLAAGTVTKFGTQALGANQELSNVAGGAVSGALIGAQIGSVGGPIGAAIGAVVGLAAGELTDTIICTELHRQGYMTDAILELDREFGAKIDAQVHSGYVLYAQPIVNLMRKSKPFTWLVSRLAMPWVEEMCHQIKPEEYRSNIIGKAIMYVGFPLCRWKGELTEEVA